MKRTIIAVDLAKSVFEIAVSEQPGKVCEQHRLGRGAFLGFFAERQPALVLMEACGSASHWARQIQQLGHQVKLLPPHSVRPYVTGNKTDRADTKGILEAERNEQIRGVPVKSIQQQTVAALHRLRSAWIAARTARINTVRGLLRELGIAIPLGAARVAPLVGELLEDADSGIPDALRPLLDEARTEILELARRARAVEKQLQALSRQMPVVEALLTIPGIGLLTSTALVAFVGDIGRFATARHFASYLGLTPRERSSGLSRRLGAISKRGNVYVRQLLIHGSRSILWNAKKPEKPDRLRTWALQVEARRGHNKAAAAVANKLARIVWAVWHRKVQYVGRPASAA